MPCKDMNKLTLQAPRNESDRQRQEAGKCRPGLDGLSGKLTRKALDIANTLSSLNPKITVIKENVAFEDLTEDWREVEKSMGNPAVILDSKDYSYTKRRRAWWVRGLFAGLDPDIICPPNRSQLDPNRQCMDKGRTIYVRSQGRGYGYVQTITAAWEGGHRPIANTHYPVKVYDGKTIEPGEFNSID